MKYDSYYTVKAKKLINKADKVQIDIQEMILENKLKLQSAYINNEVDLVQKLEMELKELQAELEIKVIAEIVWRKQNNCYYSC